MRLIGLMPVRNEAWIVGMTARAALMWCDSLVIHEHATTDNTREVLLALRDEYPGRVILQFSACTDWQEMDQRQEMLQCARSHAASHIAIVDADEIITGNLLPHIRSRIEESQPDTILELSQICLRGSTRRYECRGVWAEQHTPVAFPDRRAYHWAARNGYQLHHRTPMGPPARPWRPIPRRDGGLMHLQFVNQRRLLAKQCLYKMQEVIRWPGREDAESVNQKYNWAVYSSPVKRTNPLPEGVYFGTVPAEWWEPYAPLMQHFRPDDEPWQEAEARRLWELLGPGKFAGLDLFGVVDCIT